MLRKNDVVTLASSLLLSFSINTTFAANELPEFTKNGDGTVTHNPTGLIVKMCAEGQTWDTSFLTCTGVDESYYWENASKLKSNFLQQNDWRLPNVEEWMSVVSGIKYGMVSNQNFLKSIFPSSGINFSWTSTYCCNNNYFTGNLYFQTNGSVENNNSYRTEYNGNVYMVRSGKKIGNIIKTLKQIPISDFTNNEDGSVTHIKTGLTWKRCVEGQTLLDGYCDGTAKIYTYEEAINLTSNLGGKNDWRLPTFQELQTLADSSTGLNDYVFLNSPKIEFWSSDTYLGMDKSQAFFVSYRSQRYNFIGSSYNGSIGYTFYRPKTEKFYARLVRGTMLSPSANLASTIAVNSNPIAVNTDATITGTVVNNGTLSGPDTKLTFYILKNKMTLVNKPTDCEDKGTSVVCSLGQLDATKSATRAITVKMTAAGGMSLGITSRSNENDANMEDNIARTVVTIRK